jgi:hypothetical protein
VHLIRLNVPPKHQKSGSQLDKEIGIGNQMFRLDYLLVAGAGAMAARRAIGFLELSAGGLVKHFPTARRW